MFPSNVRHRLFESEATARSVTNGDTPNSRLRSFLSDGNAKTLSENKDSSPIADLFPDVTVMFADIAGFTSWSSTREPTQVFILLETLYSKFDAIAKRRAVFKVETIGDSYVAVCGLPEPNANHAIVMAKFANDCRVEMKNLTSELDARLGPGTAELRLRFGLNSGPVTAGVIRGEKSRFQLFGDTVNTAARMESNGIKDKIQVTESTASLIVSAGKRNWITKREIMIVAKGTNFSIFCMP
jgi:class 3 adenylate cyclase